MKQLIRNSIAIATLTVAATIGAYAGEVDSGYVDFGKFSRSAEGGEFVEVNINSNLIALVARIAEAEEPEIADLIKGLKLVRVNVIGLKDDNRDGVKERVHSIRQDLDKQGWERVVSVQQAKEDVGVFLRTRNTEAIEGIVVTVIEDRQAVLVNIVGDIRPEKIGVIGERFDIPPLSKLGKAMKKAKAPVKHQPKTEKTVAGE